MVTEGKTKSDREVLQKGHVHAALMLLYAQDAAETNKPWERWEFQGGSMVAYVALIDHPWWGTTIQYRRKPETRVVNGFTVPAPLNTIKEGQFQLVYLPDPQSCVWYLPHHPYLTSKFTLRALKRGLVFATEEAAVANAKAMCGIDPST